MKLLLRLRRYYLTLLKIGTSKEMPFSERLRIELSNLAMIIAFPALILYAIVNYFGNNSAVHYIIVAIWIVLFSIPPILNYYKKPLLGRFILFFPGLIVICVIYMLFGWVMRLETSYILMVVCAFYFFEQRIAIHFSTVILLFYALTIIGIKLFNAPLADTVIDSMPYFYFVFNLLISLSLTSRVLTENSKFNTLTRIQNKELNQKNEELERFSYIVSHDLKSPLRNIVSFSELMENSIKREEYKDVQDYASFVKGNAKHLSILVQDILELSRTNTDEFKTRSRVNLNSIVKKVQLTLSSDIKAKNVQISAGDLPSYYCNEGSFYMLFQNLIQNGIKYNESPEPSIELSAEQQNGKLLLHFKDNGIGIDKDHHEQIFDFFKRLHNKDTYEGSGIGLGLCKKIVEQYNGKIEVTSAINKGSTFTVVLPK